MSAPSWAQAYARSESHMRDQNRAPAPARQCGLEADAGGAVFSEAHRHWTLLDVSA
jgi:hypothetical protein